MASGGNLTPGSRPELGQFEPDELRAAVDEAHRLGLPVTAHAHGTAGRRRRGRGRCRRAGARHVHDRRRRGPGARRPARGDRRAAGRARADRRVGPGRVRSSAPMAVRMPALLANARLLCASGALIAAGTDGGRQPGQAARRAPVRDRGTRPDRDEPGRSAGGRDVAGGGGVRARRPHGQARSRVRRRPAGRRRRPAARACGARRVRAVFARGMQVPCPFLPATSPFSEVACSVSPPPPSSRSAAWPSR